MIIVVQFGELVVGEKAEQVVFVNPDIPTGPAFRLGVGPKISVGLLGLKQSRRNPIDLHLEIGGMGVVPGQRGGMEVFPHVFTLPVLMEHFPSLERVEEVVFIHLQHPVLGIGVDSPTKKPASESHILGKQRRENILHLSGARQNE